MKDILDYFSSLCSSSTFIVSHIINVDNYDVIRLKKKSLAKLPLNLGIWKSRKRKGNRNWKQKLEMEIGNGNGNRKRTNHWCNVFFIVCLVITLVFYLAVVIGLAVWVMSFAFTPVLCFVITAFSVNE